jgi:ammonium transporter Rh
LSSSVVNAPRCSLTQPNTMGGEETTKTNVTTVGKSFIALATVTQVVVLIGFAVACEPTSLHFKSPVQDIQLYNNYVGVTLMMFVGFGYLMTFLRWYGLGAVGLTMFITCLGMQWAMLVEGLIHHDFQHKIVIDVMKLLEGDFAVAAFLISFGGLIGKVNPAQLVVLVVLEGIFYGLNTRLILFRWLEIKDCGGSIVIHMFGAYFGLAASWILGKPPNTEKEASSMISDLFSFIGTVFLWLYWPSFVAGWLPAATVEADTALTNTVLSLLGSTVCTFILSAVLAGRILRPVDIQNATLAGGVSIGAVANLNIQPAGALAVGCAAGLLSTFGYSKVQGFLLEKLGLHDTCGIHNLHGMPSVLGGILSILLPAFGLKQGKAGPIGTVSNQLLGVVLTLCVSIVTGLLTGCAMKIFKDDADFFNDKMYWEVAEEESETQQGQV